jgi:DNA-binding MarR family transcriptional regulator
VNAGTHNIAFETPGANEIGRITMGTLKDPQRIEELLNFRLKLLFRLGGAPAVRVCEGEFGIARQHWRILAALVENGPLAVGVLARLTFIDVARISRGLGELRKMGLVERRSMLPVRTRNDAVAATATGCAMYSQLFPRLACINRRLCDVLSQEEAEQLDRILDRLTGHAAAIHEQQEVDGQPKAQRRLGGAHRVRGESDPADPAASALLRPARARPT